jgi:hypothetical protein
MRLAIIITTPHVRAIIALCLLSPKVKARYLRVNSAKKFYNAVLSGFVGPKNEGKRLGRYIFIFLGKSLLDNVTEYGLHFLSLPILVAERPELSHSHRRPAQQWNNDN